MNVVTDLYKDPANSFIDATDMIFLAQDKLRGENIEDDLARKRKWAVELHNLIEESNKK